MASDPKLANQLSETVAENLGWLSVSDLEPRQKDEFRRLVSRDLVVKARRDLPGDLAERAAVLELIGALATTVQPLGD